MCGSVSRTNGWLLPCNSTHPQVCVKHTRWPTAPHQHQPPTAPAAAHAGGCDDRPSLLSRDARIVTTQPGLNCPCCTTACRLLRKLLRKPCTQAANQHHDPGTHRASESGTSLKGKQTARNKPLSGRRPSTGRLPQQPLYASAATTPKGTTAQHLAVCVCNRTELPVGCPGACEPPSCRGRTSSGCKSCMQPLGCKEQPVNIVTQKKHAAAHLPPHIDPGEHSSPSTVVRMTL